MGYTHHPHLFSHEWFQLHPEWLAKFKTYGPPLGLGALLATAALSIWTIYAAFNMPLQGDEAVTAVADELFVPTGITGYLPPQFQARETQTHMK